MFKDDKSESLWFAFLLFSLDISTQSVYTKSVGNGR